MKRSLDHLLDDKRIAIEDILDKWTRRFPIMFDELVFKEKDRLIGLMEHDFIMQRSATRIAKLACKIRYARKHLAINNTVSFNKNPVNIQLIPTIVEFPAESKATLGILAHAHKHNQYEQFHKNQVLNLIQRVFPDIQVVGDSVYEVQPPKSMIQTVYFEICKHTGRHFSLEEIKQLREFLQKELPYSVEKVTPTLVMSRNDEECFKNILALDREIHRVSDPPQVMISLDQQTLDTVDLTILLLYVRKQSASSLKEGLIQYFSNAGPYVQLEIDRWETVRYIRQKHPVETGIMKLRIDKRLFARRNDGGLHFHLIRQKASHMLASAIGPFRDYNGGLMVKQMELFAVLKREFPEIPQDILEDFYFSLAPFEAKTMLSITILKPFFKTFLTAKNAILKSPTDCFVQITSIPNHVLVAIRVPEHNFTIDPRICTANNAYTLVSYTIADQGSCFFGYLIETTDANVADRIRQVIGTWKEEFGKQQVLRLNLLNPVISFDPRIGGDKHSSTALKLLFEGLMRFGKNGVLEYGVAKEVSISPDQKIYTFTLKNTYWSNGMPVTAKDFEYAWKTALAPYFKTSFANLFYPIKNARLAKQGTLPIDEVGIHAIDNSTLVVELEFPAPYFLESTALTVYSPIFQALDQQYPHWSKHEGTGYICNGAFCLASNNLNEQNEQHVFTKNPLYWDCPSISLEEIVALRSNVQAPFEMFRQDLVDWAGVHIKTKDSGKMLLEEDNEIVITENTGTCWIVFNTAQAPFDNKELRQALAMGVDRSKLQERFRILPAISPIPKIHSQLTESILSEYSEKKARERFEEGLRKLHLDRKDFPPIQLIHTRKHPHPQLMTFIKEEWERVFDIRCDLKPLTWDLLFSELSGNEFQVGSVVWEPWINDPIYTLNTFVKGGWNSSKWVHDRYRQIVYEAEREPDIEKRRALYAQAERILLDEMPIAPLFSTSLFALKKKNMKIDCPLNRLDFKWCHFI